METVVAAYTAPIHPSLTAWEAKERAKLLALETDECREKRRVAQDPNTTAKDLAQCASPIFDAFNADRNPHSPEYYLLAEAIIAHPNASVKALIWLFEEFYDFCGSALCRNPVTPFLALETPDFWERMDTDVYEMLLCEEALPLSVIQVLARHKAGSIAQSARLHITMSGEIQNAFEAKGAARACGFPQYAARHYPPFDLYYLREKGVSHHWKERMYAVLQLPFAEEPFPESTREYANRSPLDLIHHLARDGNRLVRWAARTRLADPDFVFTWDGESNQI